MVFYQNETGGNRRQALGARRAWKGVNRDAIGRPSRSSMGAWRPSPSGFTLTELLVVITIIAILAGLITPAVIGALNNSKRAAITLELQSIQESLELFKTDNGAYPPNGMAAGTNSMGNSVFPTAQSDLVRMFKKAFPRSAEPPILIQKLVGTSGIPGTPDMGGYLAGGMTSTEALVFWLGGFSKDPQYPISGPGGPSFSDAQGDNDGTLEGSDDVLENRNRLYEFDLGRLLPRNAAGTFDDSSGQGRYIEYQVTMNGVTQNRRINFWLYAPSGSQLPIAYVDTSRHSPEQYDPDISGGAGANIFALKKLREGFDTSTTPTRRDITFVEKGKFQVLHPGLDDEWGNFQAFSILNASVNDASAVMVYPTGPFIGEIADTLGSFMTGTLEDAQE